MRALLEALRRESRDNIARAEDSAAKMVAAFDRMKEAVNVVAARCYETADACDEVIDGAREGLAAVDAPMYGLGGGPG